MMIIYNCSELANSREGIDWYLNGDPRTDIKYDNVIPDAVGQIFFSVGVCMGGMTSLASYNRRNKPIVEDSIIICLSNSLVSFIAGFAVWSVVGYVDLTLKMSLPKASIGLVFITYPVAINTFALHNNFWALLLGFTLFTLGIDSAFTITEALSTVICDFPWMA